MDPKEFLKWFSVPNHPEYKDLYILGCFARRVTLYTQQVRALNLIAALVDEGIIRQGRQVVVVGGGAAGLTAAAGAAKCGAKVLLLEHFNTLMEPLRGNRQRWLHPFIYDWPVAGSKEPNAGLPLLNWTAGYAEQVVVQLEEQWKQIARDYSIEVVRGVNLELQKIDASFLVKWDGSASGERRNNVVILATGFGFEKHDEYQYSYWTEDSLDGSFRRPMKGQKWLVSGFGDGAFTDLMRLCIQDFRHANITDLFLTSGGLHQVTEELRKLSEQDLTSEQITEGFRTLPLAKLGEGLRKRSRGIEVFLTGQGNYPYTAKASILNRLIVAVLERNKAFTLLPGPTVLETMTRTANGKIRIQVGGKPYDDLDNIVIRHGPEDRTLKKLFSPLYADCSDLKALWDGGKQSDETKVPNWGTQFETTRRMPAQSGNAFAEFMGSAKRYGIRASGFSVSKVVRDDSVSEITYQFKDLVVLWGTLKGLKFHYESTLGLVGEPELDSDAIALGIQWQPQAKRPATQQGGKSLYDKSLSKVRDEARKLDGTFSFRTARRRKDPAVTFGFTVRVLHADAMSKWEYEQMYAPELSVHVDNERLSGAMEYIARVVWFPVESLKLKVTLPEKLSEHISRSVFKMSKPARDRIHHGDVVKDGTLQIYPSRREWRLPSSRWKWLVSPSAFESGQYQASGQMAELEVTWPSVGSCYSLDWSLPDNAGNPIELRWEQEAKDYRRKLLEYRKSRMAGAKGGQVRKLLQDFYTTIRSQFPQNDPNEKFVVSLMTYDERDRCLWLVDGLVNGGEPTRQMWKFWLPFGAGMSGVCFKQQDSFPLIYTARSDKEKGRSAGPELYLPLSNMVHTGLAAFPLEHPEYVVPETPSSFETARQRIAIIDIGSDSKISRLFEPGKDGARFDSLLQKLREFRDKLCAELLKGGGTTGG